MVRRLIDRLAGNPRTFDLLRAVLEAGYRGERQAIARCLSTSPRTLDVGCGTGALAPEFQPAGYLGIDANARYIGHARRKNPLHRFEVMDATRLDLPEACMEQVLIVGVLHHCPDPVAVRILAETRRVLVPGGRFLLIEDVPTRGRLNLIGRAVHALDEGPFIRPDGAYEALFGEGFRVAERFPMRSGVCDYACWALVTEAGASG